MATPSYTRFATEEVKEAEEVKEVEEQICRALAVVERSPGESLVSATAADRLAINNEVAVLAPATGG